MHPHVLDAEGAALLVKVRLVAIRRWAHDGEIPGTRVGGQWRFWAPSLLARTIGVAAAQDAVPPLPPDHVEPGIVDSSELAALLGFPDRTITYLMRQDRIPGEKVGGTWRTYWPSIRSKLAEGLPLTDTPELAPEEAGSRRDRP